jgi:hypothetical protein
LAWATWNANDPDTVNWSEPPNLEVVLHRVKTATTTQKPAISTDDSSGEGDDDAQ